MRNVTSLIVIGLIGLSSCKTTVTIGAPDWPSGCFRDDDRRIAEMREVIEMWGWDETILQHTVEWIRDVDSECESWQNRPWWQFWR